MKKLACFLAVILLLGCFSGCAKKEKSEENVSVSGGWTLSSPASLSMDREAFDTAFDGAEAVPQPIACLATQVVAGQNFCYLVKIAENDTEHTPGSFALCTIYAALDGSAEVTGIREIDLTAEDFGSYDVGGEPPAGGWCLCEVQPAEEDASLFSQAYGSDQSVTPVALLATQVVAGQNLLYLAQYNTNDSHKYQLVTLYLDLQNTVTVVDQQDFSILP